MCNIAGYVGDMRAAPVLIEMMKKQEGFGGGYYTGIATVADGKIHYAKVVGDISHLLKDTNAVDLPGTVGVIHSRSKSGGDKRWAHPFLSCDKNTAYIANGSGGVFHDQRNSDVVAQKLETEGHVFDSRTQDRIGKYPILQDNTSVHVSEVMCHLIESYIEKFKDPVEAMKKAYIDFPSEIVGLMVNTSLPDSIIASRISQPLMIGHNLKSTYLATTAIAFPKDVGIHTISPMPINSTARVCCESIKIIPFDYPPSKVSITIPWHLGFERINDLFSKHEQEYYLLTDLIQATSGIWEENSIRQSAMMVYEILRTLYEDGKVDFKHINVEGVLPGSKVVKNAIYTL